MCSPPFANELRQADVPRDYVNWAIAQTWRSTGALTSAPARQSRPCGVRQCRVLARARVRTPGSMNRPRSTAATPNGVPPIARRDVADGARLIVGAATSVLEKRAAPDGEARQEAGGGEIGRGGGQGAHRVADADEEGAVARRADGRPADIAGDADGRAVERAVDRKGGELAADTEGRGGQVAADADAAGRRRRRPRAAGHRAADPGRSRGSPRASAPAAKSPDTFSAPRSVAVIDPPGNPLASESEAMFPPTVSGPASTSPLPLIVRTRRRP